MLIQKNRGIEQLDPHNREMQKLDPQLQGQLIEALELLKDVVDEALVISPNLVTDIKVAVWQIFEP